MRSFCFCPNECNSLHWWAKQKEILYNNEDNLRGNQHPASLIEQNINNIDNSRINYSIPKL